MLSMNPQKYLSSISAVFPAFNDAATISSMVLAALIALRQVTDDFEIIVTNDGSADLTGKILDEMAGRFPELSVIHHAVNLGYGAALRSGFEASTKDWIFYTDGDAQYDPSELVNLVQAAEVGVDVVNGYKISRSDPLYRKIIGRLYHHATRLLFNFELQDVDCDFRLFKRSLLERVDLESDTGTICVEMVKKFQVAGAKFVEVPVHHYPRPFGVSQFFNPKHLSYTLRHLVCLWRQLVFHRQGKKLTWQKAQLEAKKSSSRAA
jgi:cellulose synthase/poly-beta-1,6-N-acetylglucosamine synthase-like glycosyltransferase